MLRNKETGGDGCSFKKSLSRGMDEEMTKIKK
jgi:hypothetical protein